MFVWNAKKALIAANAANIAASQSPGAGAITLVSTPVVLDTPRRVLVTFGGADTGVTVTINGTNQTGNPLSETITGVSSGTVATTQDFSSVTSVSHTGSFASTMSIGTNAVGSTPWFQVNTWAEEANFGIGVAVSGTINYTVEYTYDDPNAPFTGIFPTVWALSALTSKAANTDSNVLFPVNAWRLTVNSGTGTGFLQIIQSGSVGG